MEEKNKFGYQMSEKKNGCPNPYTEAEMEINRILTSEETDERNQN